MKKAIVLSVLGLAASGIAAFGQGQIAFNNYNTTSYQPVYFSPTSGPAGQLGWEADTTTEVQLFYIIGNVSGDSLATFYAAATGGNTTFISATFNGGGTYVGSPAAAGAVGKADRGYYNGPIQDLTGWTSGATVTFGAEGWETAGTYGGATYATSLLRGQSALWTEMAEINPTTGSPPPSANFMANGPTPLVLGVVSVVPEPSTLAFAGLGMLALLAFARRKNV